jgi:hypothetical protein
MIQASSIREHMEVVGRDGKHVGKVDEVMGDEIKLTRSMGMGAHHALPISLVDRIDGDKLRLTITEDEAKDRWRELH